MRNETRRRLERALLAQKLKWGGLGILVATALVSIFYFQNLDDSIASTRVIEGTVVHVGPLAGKQKAALAESRLQIDVRLDGDRIAHLVAPSARAPSVGDHVLVADQTHGTGRHTFAWK